MEGRQFRQFRQGLKSLGLNKLLRRFRMNSHTVRRYLRSLRLMIDSFGPASICGLWNMNLDLALNISDFDIV